MPRQAAAFHDWRAAVATESDYQGNLMLAEEEPRCTISCHVFGNKTECLLDVGWLRLSGYREVGITGGAHYVLVGRTSGARERYRGLGHLACELVCHRKAGA